MRFMRGAVSMLFVLMAVFVIFISCGKNAVNDNGEDDDNDSNEYSLFEEVDTDYIGIWTISPHYDSVMSAGAKVINLVDDSSFFVLWVPENYSELSEKRVMIAMHGTAGKAYEEARWEIAMGSEYGYAVIAIQWEYPYFSGDSLDSVWYFDNDKVYHLIDTALGYMEYKYGADLQKVAYEGFSRGSAISYEVTYLDKSSGNNYFALTISHSGGIPFDSYPQFIDDLLAGEYGTSAFSGKNFFLYCGMEDDHGEDTTMCAQMENAYNIITEYGANVVEFIEDSDGEHNGYHADEENHRAAVEWFIELTS